MLKGKGLVFGAEPPRLCINSYQIPPPPPSPQGYDTQNTGDTQVTVTLQLFKQALRNHDRGGAKTSLYLDLLHTNYHYSIYPVSSNN